MARNQSVPTNPQNETSYVDGTREHLLIVSGEEAPDRDYARVMLAQPYQWTEEEIQRDLYTRPPFSLSR